MNTIWILYAYYMNTMYSFLLPAPGWPHLTTISQDQWDEAGVESVDLVVRGALWLSQRNTLWLLYKHSYGKWPSYIAMAIESIDVWYLFDIVSWWFPMISLLKNGDSPVRYVKYPDSKKFFAARRHQWRGCARGSWHLVMVCAPKILMPFHDLSCMFIVFHPFPIFSPCHILIICCNLHVETKLFGFASNSHLGDLSTARSATPGHGLRFRSWCNKFASCLKLVGGLEHEVYFSIDCKSSSQLTNIFQRGWNHQPGSVFWGLVQSGVCLKNLCSVQSDGLSGWWSFDVPILRQNYVCLQRFTDEDLKYGRLVF